jgi:hypothetical protein
VAHICTIVVYDFWARTGCIGVGHSTGRCILHDCLHGDARNFSAPRGYSVEGAHFLGAIGAIAPTFVCTDRAQAHAWQELLDRDVNYESLRHRVLLNTPYSQCTVLSRLNLILARHKVRVVYEVANEIALLRRTVLVTGPAQVSFIKLISVPLLSRGNGIRDRLKTLIETAYLFERVYQQACTKSDLLFVNLGVHLCQNLSPC